MVLLRFFPEIKEDFGDELILGYVEDWRCPPEGVSIHIQSLETVNVSGPVAKRN